jgi:hypothetical protein
MSPLRPCVRVQACSWLLKTLSPTQGSVQPVPNRYSTCIQKHADSNPYLPLILIHSSPATLQQWQARSFQLEAWPCWQHATYVQLMPLAAGVRV